MAKEYAIVGAGMAGLAAAEVIHALDSTATITLYEALSVVGGRASTQDFGGDVMDWGCEALEAGDNAPTVVLKASGTPLKKYTVNDDAPLDSSFEPTDCNKKLYYSFFNGKATDISKAVWFADSPNIDQFQDNIDAVENDPTGNAADSALHGVVIDLTDADTTAERMKILGNQILFGEGAPPGYASLRDANRADQLQAQFGQSPGTVYFKEGLGDTVVKWATDNVLSDVTLVTGATVSKVQNVMVDADDEKVPKVELTFTKNSNQAKKNFDAVLVTVPSNAVTATLVPELSTPALKAFRSCPLGIYYKVLITGIKGTVAVPPANRRVFATIKTLGDPVHIGQSPNGKFCYMHAAGVTGLNFSQDPKNAEKYIRKALRALNPGALDFSAASYVHCPWFTAPGFGGSYSYCKTGKDTARLVLASLKVGHIYFAGEACSPIWYGQLAGAMESGQRMARQLVTDMDDD
ncbi:MAG: hypothetical protein EP335_10710 [Alphaproteobacteria bacterium]|nr:MAG: hypothetical protein EP335_10710 [Alphaproteobacteria bacterium]